MARKRITPGKIRLAEVAKLAGVSPITASRFFRNPDALSAGKRARVESAAKELGYVPNLAARALASQRTEVIGVLIPSLTNNVFADVMRGIDEGLQGSPLIVQLGTTRYSPLTEEQLIRVFLSQRPAGLIVAGHDQSPAARALLAEAGVQTPIRVEMQIGNNPIAQQVGQVIQAMAAETGFDISLRATEFATLLSENVAGNFDMSLQGWSGRIDPDANIHPFVGSDGANNDQHYRNAEIDVLLAQARSEPDTAARKALMISEKELTQAREAVSRQRRELPWVKVDKDYVFDGPGGKVTLGDLFKGRPQLVVQHVMFAPEWDAACKSCSFWVDGFERMVPHLAARDTTMVAISRAPAFFSITICVAALSRSIRAPGFNSATS